MANLIDIGRVLMQEAFEAEKLPSNTSPAVLQEMQARYTERSETIFNRVVLDAVGKKGRLSEFNTGLDDDNVVGEELLLEFFTRAELERLAAGALEEIWQNLFLAPSRMVEIK